MIMGHGDCAGRQADRFAKNLARMRETRRGRPRCGFHALDEPALRVQAQHPQFLDGQTLDVGMQIRGDQIRPVEQRRFAGLLAEHATRHFHHGQKLQRLDAPDAFEPAVIRLAPGQQTGQRTRFVDEPLGEGEHIVAARAAAQQHGEQFDVAQGPGAHALETLLRALVDGHRLEPVGRIGGRLCHRGNVCDGPSPFGKLRSPPVAERPGQSSVNAGRWCFRAVILKGIPKNPGVS